MGQSHSDTINGSAKEYYPNFEMTVLVGFGIEVPFNNILRLAIDNNLSMNVLPIADAWGEENIKMFDINLAVGLAYTFNRKNSKSVNIKD